MAENVPQPNRRKTVKKAFIALHNFLYSTHLSPEPCDLAPIFYLWLFVSDNKTVPLK